MSVKHHQRCFSSPSKKPVPLTDAGGRKQEYEKGAFLTSCGEDTGYFYATVADKLSIFTSNCFIENATLNFSLSFGSDAEVIDCVFFPLADDLPGLVVAVYDTSLPDKQYYLSYVSLTKKRVLKKIFSPGPISCIANIIDGAAYGSQVDGLNKTFRDHWCHIIAVSVYGVGAVLTHLGIRDEEAEDASNIHKAPNSIILGKTFLRSGSDKFEFIADAGRKYLGKRTDFYASSFSFLVKSAVIIIGFPFGGIFMVSLRTQRPYSFFMCEGVIENITIQSADDDPRGLIYIWFVISRPDKAHAVSATVMFSDEDERNKVYDHPSFVFGMNFLLPEFLQFVSMKTVFVDRQKLAGSSKDFGDASMNESMICGNKSSSLVLFVWISTSSKLFGALFDLNMYYYKRMPSRLMEDNTVFRQIPCCAGFKSDDSIDINQIEIYDVMVMPNSLRAFTSIENESADQLFYPSVYSYYMKVMTKSDARYFNVSSIQEQHMADVSKNFSKHWNDPADVCMRSYGLGVAQQPYEKNDRRFYFLSCLLKHGYHFPLLEFIKDTASIEDLNFIGTWLNMEASEAKKSLDKFAEPLINGSEISQSALQYIRFSEFLYDRILQILNRLIERYQSMEKLDELKAAKVGLSLVTSLSLFAIAIKYGIEFKMLPRKASMLDVNRKLRQQFVERQTLAHKNGEKLAIVDYIKECMQSTDRDLWSHSSAEQWYPPAEYSDWLNILLAVNLSKTAKVMLFGYYILDLEKSGLLPKNRLFDAVLGYMYFTESDKHLTIKNRIVKMFKADERSARTIDWNCDVERMVQAIRHGEGEKRTLSFDDLKQLPLMDKEQIDSAKQKFLENTHGIHLWNLSVIDKRRFELIEEVKEIPHVTDPPDVRRSRDMVKKIKADYPYLFHKSTFLPMVNAMEKTSKANEMEVNSSKKLNTSHFSNSRKRTLGEVLDVEEDSFLLTTPVKQSRKSLFMNTPAAKAFKDIVDSDPSTPTNEHDITVSPVVVSDVHNGAVSERQWQKIKMLTKTPPATPLTSRIFMTPEPGKIKQPTSILKSNKTASKIHSIKRPRLQFEDMISQVKAIPNRHEQKEPIPDAFTMDDSVVSTIEVQDEEDAVEEEKGDSDIDPSSDNLQPMKLNFDVAEEEEEKETTEDESEPPVDNDDTESEERMEEGEEEKESEMEEVEEEKESEMEEGEEEKESEMEEDEKEETLKENERTVEVHQEEVQEKPDAPLTPLRRSARLQSRPTTPVANSSAVRALDYSKPLPSATQTLSAIRRAEQSKSAAAINATTSKSTAATSTTPTRKADQDKPAPTSTAAVRASDLVLSPKKRGRPRRN